MNLENKLQLASSAVYQMWWVVDTKRETDNSFNNSLEQINFFKNEGGTSER
jgi:hypothetical protein